MRHFRDPWFNYVHWFDINEPHTSLSIEAQITLNTSSQYAAGFPLQVPFSALQEMRDDSIRIFTKSSTYVDIDRAVWKEAIDVSHGSEGIFEAAQAIMRHVHTQWLYMPGTTHASTHMREVMTQRRGVCQDFAHVMIGLCRALGIPTRYVSGYLYNGPADSLRGAQASHAWCEVHIPAHGWFGLDPTNNTLADERHAKIATCRDYADAAPLTGTFDGPANATSSLQVELEIISDPA
ncbi:MAG: transglutaminase family protein [Verrucomicrobiaceae bacterium]|nr:transglutaminase family protein [Verrucomicrobiaceae bacterium]